MNIRLGAARICMPRRLKLKRLHDLLTLTAEAFGSPVPDIRCNTVSEFLESYAVFTSGMAEAWIGAGKQETLLRERLCNSGFSFGAGFRRMLRVRSGSEVMRAARLLYSVLGIEMDCEDHGSITIRRCFFARYYSPETCRLISALDEGVLSGLAGGGSLAFTGRITEGSPTCRASFQFPGDLS